MLRMSDRLVAEIVLICLQGHILLYCKGADTMVLERISAESGRQKREVTQTHLDKFAAEGLRTLCLAYKEITADFYKVAHSYRARSHTKKILGAGLYTVQC